MRDVVHRGSVGSTTPRRAPVRRCWLASYGWCSMSPRRSACGAAVEHAGVEQFRHVGGAHRTVGHAAGCRAPLRPAAPASTDRASRCARCAPASAPAALRLMRAPTRLAPSEMALASPGTEYGDGCARSFGHAPLFRQLAEALGRRRGRAIRHSPSWRRRAGAVAEAIHGFEGDLPSARGLAEIRRRRRCRARTPRAHRHSSTGRLRRDTACTMCCPGACSRK